MAEIAPDRTVAVAVVGTALAGLATALALARSGVGVALIGRPPSRSTAPDRRSTALFGPSLDLLRAIGVGDAMARAGVPMLGLRIVDATGSLFRAPDVTFRASELGLDEFGLNIENEDLLAALETATRGAATITWHESPASVIELGPDEARIHLADATQVTARLVIGADGAHSLCRTAAGIATRTWTYPQTAVVTRFAHERPHDGISTELHRRAGPLTTVPLAGDNASLVWVESPHEAERLMALDDRAFAAALETCLGGVTGRIGAIGPRGAFPLSGVTAERLADRRVALVGEAAHRLPPIGAQGLNLGLRDAAWLAELVAAAVTEGRDPGSPDVLAAYERARRTDVLSRTTVVDVLNRTLISGLLPADAARAAGLLALKSFTPLRHLVMRQGIAPPGPLPRLMQPVA